MKILKIILKIVVFCFLTILTQVGGIVYILSYITHKPINDLINNKNARQVLKFASFLLMYCLVTFYTVPFIAKPFGRVQLPLNETNHLKPLNIFTCLLNRNYVNPELSKAVFIVAEQTNKKFPGTTVNYLDASFPFLNGFPLFPHLSHNDGEKLDLSFCYLDNKTDKQTNDCPSLIGYGICEEPLPGEISAADYCSSKGYWQYSLLKEIMPQGNKQNFTFDSARTKALVTPLALQSTVGKIFIEPHLRTRLGLTSEKIRFHGCHAVRHDDHIHLQLR